MGSKEISSYIEGFNRFKSEWFQKSQNNGEDIFSKQSPKTLIIACSDSRVDPAILFGTDPGDIFVIRNVANLVPPFVKDTSFHGISAAIEYSVQTLNVRDIIVLGHSRCGGIHALISPHSSGEFLPSWLSIASGALLRVKIEEYDSEEELVRACEKEAVLISLGNLLTFPWINERIAKSELAVHGWYFDLEHGKLEGWQPKEKKFLEI
ncbi:MAG: carbonic anhydrase [Deferribacteraceae bacterium]|nr:carbonic anhydrase [Deferribacteraceae bacterium]